VAWAEDSSRSADGDRVAIVVVNHNKRILISELIFSLYRILGRDQFAAVVVVDNASTDGSVQVLRALADAQLIHLIANKRQRHHGSGLNQAVSWLASRQAGLREKARIDYVWALDSDTLILRRDTIRDALDVLRRPDAAIIGESLGEYDGYQYMPAATLMFKPGLVWRDPIAPFRDDGSPEMKLLQTATDAGYGVVPFPFLRHSYALHLVSGTLMQVAERERRNRWHVWAKRNLHGRRHFNYSYHPLGAQLHCELRSAYEREIPDDSPERLVRACLRGELIAVSDARSLPDWAVLKHLYDKRAAGRAPRGRFRTDRPARQS
jgi:glycosyltransferase involved in cell wall biosynthesis